MNMLAMTTTNPNATNQVYNTAFGERTTLNQLVGYLKEFLSEFHPRNCQRENNSWSQPLGGYSPFLGMVLIKQNPFKVTILNTVCVTV